jgi:hypothetical protein
LTKSWEEEAEEGRREIVGQIYDWKEGNKIN